MRTLVTALMVSIASGSIAAEDVLVNRQAILKKCAKIGVFQNIVKQAQTPEGKAIIGTALTLVGVDPSTTVGMIGTIPVQGDSGAQDTYPFIRSPEGYTICTVRNVGVGSGQHGIETHGDTTLNATLKRSAKLDGVAMYMVVPCKVGTDTRVHAQFDVVFVKPHLLNTAQCLKDGQPLWHARNNGTKIWISSP